MVEHNNKTRCLPPMCAQSNLSVSESSDGHPRDPAVLQVPVSRWNDDLVQEVHP